jgi:hypothetical protein
MALQALSPYLDSPARKRWLTAVTARMRNAAISLAYQHSSKQPDRGSYVIGMLSPQH